MLKFLLAMIGLQFCMLAGYLGVDNYKLRRENSVLVSENKRLLRTLRECNDNFDSLHESFERVDRTALRCVESLNQCTSRFRRTN